MEHKKLWKIKDDIFLKLYERSNLSLDEMRNLNIMITNYFTVIQNLLFINVNKQKRVNGKS